MTRNILITAVVALASLSIVSSANADKGGGNKWKGPPPHGNAWGHYKNGWPADWYGAYPNNFAPPPAYYGWPPPTYGYPPAYGIAAPPPEILPPPPPTAWY